MKKYLIGVAVVLMALSPAFVQASGLTSAQTDAILSLLSSFGANSATIADVNAALVGTNQTAGVLNAVNSTTTGAWAAAPSLVIFNYTWTRDLQSGSKRTEDIKNLQKVLTLQGFYAGPTNGIFDKQTAEAVKKFQQKNGIKATGYVGSGTRAKLNALYGKSSTNPGKAATKAKTTVSTVQNSMILGKITSITANAISVKSGTKMVQVTFDSLKDKIMKLQTAQTTSTVSESTYIDATFGELKIGDSIMVKIIGGKKTIYLLSN